MQIVEELHAARVGKTVDLPVVPPPGELSSMEIDLVEDDVHSSAGIADIHMMTIFIVSCAFLRMNMPTFNFYNIWMKNVKIYSFEIIKNSVFLLAIGIGLISVLSSFVFISLTLLGRYSLFLFLPRAVSRVKLFFISAINCNF